MTTTRSSSRPAAAARVAAALGAAALLTLAAPLAASAHVRVNPAQVDPGSYATLTFKVPTESATAGTVGLTVDLPTDTPFTSVTYQPLPGWTTVVTTSTLPEPVQLDGATVTEAPTEVTWTADPGTQVGPGEFQQFVISAGAVPETGSITLPAHQTYSDGSVVDWADETPASGEEPEFPAPVLYVEDAPPADEHGGHDMSGGADGAAVAAGDDSSSGDAGSASDSVAVGIGIGGLALGAVALVVSVVALTRRPRAAGATRPGTDGAGERR
ncbi:YcnI family protein [Frigoribacterium sp. CFBP 8766]|uniref:YcnI family copper-binding membrane protein n=1 Tax=Frigoribacterium sp. CFBP 8766 TaxID=2775273 RepID=UPI00177AD42D|nr:YcnI family protein [Frigoribacterium sp. CFBP 8766]MBD8583845.1 YcnI family protein [Frigoribacterium sp. CFBP 8766]